MKLNEENYMDKFNSPEEFIRQQILARGNFSKLDKKEIYRLLRNHNIEFQINKNGLSYTKKQDMLDALLTKVTYRELAKYVNVSRKSFCLKFGITIEEFKVLVEKGLINVTNKYIGVKNWYTDNPKWSQWKGYDVYDYFELTNDKIHNALHTQ